MPRFPKWLPTALSVLVGTGVVSPIVSANWQEWAKVHGSDQFLIQYVDPAMTRLAQITLSGPFVFVTAMIIGGAFSLWADTFVRRWSQWWAANSDKTFSFKTIDRRLASMTVFFILIAAAVLAGGWAAYENRKPALLQSSETDTPVVPAHNIDTHLYLQFGAANTLAVAAELANVFRWYALKNIAVFVSPDGKRHETASWSLFIAFEKPVDVRQVIVEGDAHLPQYEVKDSSPRSVVVAFLGDIINASVRVKVDTSVGAKTQAAKSQNSTPVIQAPTTTVPAPSSVLSPRDVRELLDALADAHVLDEKSIAPVIYAISTLSVNWQGALRNGNLAQQLTELREKLQTDVWGKIDDFVYEKNKRHEAEMQTAFALDHIAAKGELARTLQTTIQAVQRLPRNAPPEMDELVAPQFKELARQANIAYEWLLEVRTRIAAMTDNLNKSRVTGYERN